MTQQAVGEGWGRGMIGLAVLLAGVALARGAAPPQPGVLRLQDRQQMVKLQNLLGRHLLAGRFEEATQGLRQVAEIRERRQGGRHWETVDAWLLVERWRQLEKVAKKDRADFVGSLLKEVEGSRLAARGEYRSAEKARREALAICRKALGEERPHIATSLNKVAACLDGLGKGAESLSLHRQALAICRKALGDQHPDTATEYDGVAACLDGLGKRDEALPLFRKALEISRKTLGEERPSTATSYHNIASCLNREGKRGEAIRHLRLALTGLDAGRQSAGPGGFDRSLFAATQAQPRALLACLLAAEGKAVEAWQHAEAHLARGLLEVLPARHTGADQNAHSAELTRLDAKVVPLLGLEKPTADQEKQRDELVAQRRRLLTTMARAAAERLDKMLWSYPQVQKHLPADAAVVLWLDAADLHFACVLRRGGEPRWQRLPGSDKAGGWTQEDWQLAGRAHSAVQQAQRTEEARKLIEQLRQQRFVPLEKHLKAEGDLPAVRRLIVIPFSVMASVPVELLAEDITVSYAPSATLFARRASQSRSARLQPLLALGDPVFHTNQTAPPAAPEHGLLLRAVLPGGNAARAGLRGGDVLLRYHSVRLRSVADFKAAEGDESVKASTWREGAISAVRLRSGALGASFDERPVAKALAAWRETDRLIRGGETIPRLSGTRFEVVAIASLVGKEQATVLLGSSASEQKLDRLINAGTLKQARVIHLATHGQIYPQHPEHSAVLLAMDQLPDALEQQRRGRKVYDGALRVGTILGGWDLDADLVVLSACETAQGKEGGGEGLLGFAQAFLQKGARSVVLSRWKVDDTATALLMVRFYENLLGKRKGMSGPLGRAEALGEAKKWLRGLSRKEAEPLVVRLAGGQLRGTIDEALPEVKGAKKARLPEGERPFAAPAYWAAFVLIGDPS